MGIVGLHSQLNKGADAAWDEFQERVTQLLREAPDADGWSIQGLGMLRLYMTEDKSVRLHIWDREAIYKPRPSMLHTHPWHFKSLTIAGRLTNMRYIESGKGANTADYLSQEIICGPGGCSIGQPTPTYIANGSTRSLGPRDTYAMQATEIHQTQFFDGTVSIITREFLGDTEKARVFWPAGEQWISAEPRPAMRDEVARAAEKALKLMGAK